MNTQVNVDKSGTTTLATAGKYCDRDIDINVAVSLTPWFDGTVSGEYVDSKITTLKSAAFADCNNLTKVSLPNCTAFTGNIGRYFYNCNAIVTLELPQLQIIEDGNYTFYGLENIERIDLPELTTIAANFGGTFWNCKKAKVINLPKLSNSSISTFAFRYCFALEKLILGGDVLNPLTNSNAFNNGNNNFTIYVNDNLVEDYKKATNWNAFASRIKGISELED